MALHESAQHRPKTLGESAVCFTCAAAILAAAALAMQWFLHLLP